MTRISEWGDGRLRSHSQLRADVVDARCQRAVPNEGMPSVGSRTDTLSAPLFAFHCAEVPQRR